MLVLYVGFAWENSCIVSYLIGKNMKFKELFNMCKFTVNLDYKVLHPYWFSSVSQRRIKIDKDNVKIKKLK